LSGVSFAFLEQAANSKIEKTKVKTFDLFIKKISKFSILIQSYSTFIKGDWENTTLKAGIIPFSVILCNYFPVFLNLT